MRRSALPFALFVVAAVALVAAPAPAFAEVTRTIKADLSPGSGSWMVENLAGKMTIVAGSGPDEERQCYTSIIDELGISGRVTMTGQVNYEDVGMLMNLATVFVLPSYQEPFGLVLLEAIACGARVIATDQGWPPHFVPSILRDRRHAILVKGLSRADATGREAEMFVGRLAAGISEQLTKPLDIAIRNEIAQTVQHLTWDSYVERLMREYRTAATDGARA